MFFFKNTCGNILSKVILSSNHQTHTNEVKTAQLSTRKASIDIIVHSNSHADIFHICDNKVFLYNQVMLFILIVDKAKNAIRGLSIVTKIHIFLNVFGKTHFFCSSIKLAELSNPDIQSIDTENHKNIAIKILLSLFSKFQFSINMPNQLLYK